MRAVGLVAVQRFRGVDIPVPVAGAHDVVVRVAAVSICGSDLSGYLGTHPRIRPPTVLGHEIAGTVESAGSAVTSLGPGDRVAIDPTFGCGQCRDCRSGRANICRSYLVLGESIDHPGGLAGLVAISEDHAYRLPESVSLEAGAIAQPLSVAAHAVKDRGAVQPGETVLIFGAGPIGLGIMLAARVAGARTIVSDPLEDRLRLAHELGADIVVRPGVDEIDRVVREATDGYGADATFEAVGGAGDQLLAEAVALTARGGRVVIVGLKTPEARVPIGDIKWGEKQIMGSQAHPGTFPEVLARIAGGSYPADRLVTHRFAWDRVDEAFGLLARRSPGVMKIVLSPPRADRPSRLEGS